MCILSSFMQISPPYPPITSNIGEIRLFESALSSCFTTFWKKCSQNCINQYRFLNCWVFRKSLANFKSLEGERFFAANQELSHQKLIKFQTSTTCCYDSTTCCYDSNMCCYNSLFSISFFSISSVNFQTSNMCCYKSLFSISSVNFQTSNMCCFKSLFRISTVSFQTAASFVTTVSSEFLQLVFRQPHVLLQQSLQNFYSTVSC